VGFSDRKLGWTKWWTPAIAVATTAALTATAFAAGSSTARTAARSSSGPLTLSVTTSSYSTQFFVEGGLSGRVSVYVYRLITHNLKLVGHTSMIAARRDFLSEGSRQRVTLSVNRSIRAGVYEALEINGAGHIVVSQPYAVKELNPMKAVFNLGGTTPMSPALTMGSVHARAIRSLGNEAGTLNGPTCGTLSFSYQSSTGWTMTWSGCSSLVDGQLVTLVGAAPLPGGGNPFDNPPDVKGIWYGYVANGEVSITAGFKNNIDGSTISNGEWFAMAVFSSSVEPPAGELPEVPWAIAMPAILLGVAAGVDRRRRLNRA
jgi:hypothetical protein